MQYIDLFGTNEGGSVPESSAETAVTPTLILTRQLLESLTKWSSGKLTESEVSDVYVRLGNRFNAAVAAFQTSGIDVSDLLSIPDDLRRVLEQALSEEATPENLEIYLPDVRVIIRRLLKELRVEQHDYDVQESNPSELLGHAPWESPTPQHQDGLSETSTHAEPLHSQPGNTLPLIVPFRDTSTKPRVTSPTTITRQMSVTEVLEHLGHHGCNDISSQLDTFKSSEYPIFSGGYGDVYRGALLDGSPVAVKCLRLHLDSTEISQKQLRRAAQEIYVWSKCIHPNVVGLTGVAQYRNQLAMVSPWMEYGNLRHLLSREPTIDRYHLCAQIVDGIVYLHASGVVHGDLKGDNILFSSDFTPKLADFGNATLKEYTLLFSQTTSRAGMSLNWVAPEVLTEETGITPEADIWSLGMTMLEVMTGEPPYAGMREFSIMRRIEGNILPARPEAHIPSRNTYADLLWSLFKACWTYDPLQRPSAIAVLNKMNAVISERDIMQLSSQSHRQL